MCVSARMCACMSELYKSLLCGNTSQRTSQQSSCCCVSARVQMPLRPAPRLARTQLDGHMTSKCMALHIRVCMCVCVWRLDGKYCCWQAAGASWQRHRGGGRAIHTSCYSWVSQQRQPLPWRLRLSGWGEVGWRLGGRGGGLVGGSRGG